MAFTEGVFLDEIVGGVDPTHGGNVDEAALADALRNGIKPVAASTDRNITVLLQSAHNNSHFRRIESL